MVYLEIIIKSVSTYILMLIFIKIIGKAGFARMTPYDLTFVLIIAAVLGMPLVNPNSSYLYSLIVFIVGLIMQQFFSRMSLKDRIRNLIEIKPTVIIIDGQILKKNMSKTQFDMMQLLAALRIKGIRDISEVELGTLEPNGDFSIIKKLKDKPEKQLDSTYTKLKEEALDLIKNK